MTRKKRRKLQDQFERYSASKVCFDPSCPICVAMKDRNNVEILPGVVMTFLTPDEAVRFRDLHPMPGVHRGAGYAES